MFEVKPEAWVEAINTFIWGQIKFIFFENRSFSIVYTSALLLVKDRNNNVNREKKIAIVFITSLKYE